MNPEINRWPARFDLLQGLTGLILVLFMWAHMFLVSSILLGKDAMAFVTRLLEGEPIFGRSYPIIVSVVAFFIFSLVVIHAFFAIRKIPSSYREYRQFHAHMQRFHHLDTWTWYAQVLTGFVLFFLIPIHLYQVMMHPGDIGPYASADRIWTGHFWPLYLFLLFAVEIHAGVGIYRLVIKWGILLGDNPARARRRLHRIKWCLTVFFIVLGLLTLAAYMKIGFEHADRAGERYIPTVERSLAAPDKPAANIGEQ